MRGSTGAAHMRDSAGGGAGGGTGEGCLETVWVRQRGRDSPGGEMAQGGDEVGGSTVRWRE